MEIRFMKRDSLNTLKSSLKKTFTNYFIEKDSSWTEEICDGNPFVKFRSVPDFQLVPPVPNPNNKTIGEIEIENSKRVYKNLRFLTPSQAADERLWAGLCHDVFYDYVRQRFGYDADQKAFSTDNDDDDGNDDEITGIQNRFFFSRKHPREQLLTNPISRYWWTGRAFYDDTEKGNPFKRLDVIGENDLYRKIFSTMTRSFAANLDILKGVVKCFEHFNRQGVLLNVDKHLRPALKEINKVGGAVVLDCLTEKEIATIMIEHVEKICTNKQGRKIYDNGDNESRLD